MILTTEERIYYTSRHFKRNEKEEGSAFFRRLHIPSSDRAGQNIQLNFLSWNNRLNFWIIFLSFFFSWKKKKKMFIFVFFRSHSITKLADGSERKTQKDEMNINLAIHIYQVKKKSMCVRLSGSLSLVYLECKVFPYYMFQQIDHPGVGKYSFIHGAIITYIAQASHTTSAFVFVFVFVRSSRNFSDWINFCSASEMSGNRRTLAFQLYPVSYLLYSLGAQVRRRKMK